ncbi:putative transcriptional regulator [Hartmannibacter diazotrophicus]|uniref:Putative transcriptional regulator n=2 Tax=Hartmannibacter diazotrophicus TaxID=1482074 RepID=A0A2C9D593_9HYPH|nr:putative transcriptional regulator [Hartmannibacter diazotrophicus]
MGLSQAALAREAGISPSYLNLIEAGRRDVGGALLIRLASRLDLAIDELTGARDQRLLQDLAEAAADPLIGDLDLDSDRTQELAASFPDAAKALARLHRAYQEASASADAFANRLRADPLFAELLHQILSQITAVRSGTEILSDVPDLSPEERSRFLGNIAREARAMSDVARTLIGEFDRDRGRHRSLSPARELDELIVEERNHFPTLEAVADDLRRQVARFGPIGEAGLEGALEQQFGITVSRGGPPPGGGSRKDRQGTGQYHYDSAEKLLWFRGSATVATRQFQMTRLYCELAASDAIARVGDDVRLTSPDARRLARRAMASYLAGAFLLPYGRFLTDAEENRYDIDFLAQAYSASFEQVAHRLVTLRRKGEEGIPFGFLRSDPAGRLTKHFPLPGLLLPNSGHACPLWAIYGAFRKPGEPVRQIVRFADGSRYLFIAKTVSKRLATYREQPFHLSVMLACDILHADRTIYAAGLDLDDLSADVAVGPSCRLCIRRDCEHRQEEPLAGGRGEGALHEPFVGT